VSPAAIYRHFADRDALLEIARVARRQLAMRMLDEAARLDEAGRQARSIGRFLALGRGYLGFADEQPNLLATAFLPIPPPDDQPEDPNPWHLLAAALDELVASGATPSERRSGAEVVAWSTVHGLRDAPGEPIVRGLG
jgi:AcrR family transcriptional regulator